MEAAFDEAIRERTADFPVHVRHNRRRRVQIHHLTEGHQPASPEIAAEQIQRRGALGIGGLANQYRRQLDARAALAHDLRSGVRPVDKCAASAAPQHRRLCAERGRHAGTMLLPFRPIHQTIIISAAMAARNVPANSHSVR